MEMLKTRVFFWYCFLFAPLCANAQILKFDQLGIQQGLPTSEVYNLFQDKQGYIWAFTEMGIVKHNGRQFLPACRNLAVGQSAIYTVRGSLSGDMYIANSMAKIFKVINDSAFAIRGIEEVSQHILKRNEVVYDMLVLNESNIIFSTFRKSYQLTNKGVSDISGNNVFPFQTSSYIKQGNRYVAVKTRLNNTFSEVKTLSGKLIRKIPAIKDPSWGGRCHIREFGGRFYILSDLLITCIDEQGGIKQVELAKTGINLEISPTGNVWVGTAKGLLEFDANLSLCNRYFNNCIVSDILFDNKNGMWVSTIDQGVYYCNNIYNSYYQEEELKGRISLVKQVHDKLFIGTSDGCLFVKEHAGLEKINALNTNYYITDIVFFDGEYIVGTKGKIIALDTNLRAARTMEYIDQGSIAMNSYGFAGEDGDTLFSISGTAIFYKIKGSNKFVKGLLSEYKTRSITKPEKSPCLIGTSQGILELGEKFNIPLYLEMMKGKEISGLTTDKQQNIWVATKGYGLYLISPGRALFKAFSSPSAFIYDVNRINDSAILLSANNGLFVNYVSGLGSKQWIKLLHNEVTMAEVYDNKIYAATRQGLLELNEVLPDKVPYPLFYLSSVSVRGKTIKDSLIELRHQENDIVFQFDVLNYASGEQPIYYKLSGPYPDKGWVTGNTLRLQNLIPGDYTLLVDLVEINGTGSGYCKEIRFFIKPAFWQTSVFYTLVVLGFLSLMGFILYRQREKERRKARIISEMAGYQLTALKAQINPHFISNSLSAIQQLVFNNDIDQANQYTAKFSLLLRYVLQHSDKYTTQLTREIEIIDIIVELEQLRFGNQFVFIKELSPEINTDEVYVPALITQPIIENAIWHGLLPLRGKRKATLTFKTTLLDDAIVISIIDNGLGRRIKSNDETDKRRESKGMAILKTWADNMNKLFQTAKAEIRIIDLKNMEGEPNGTRVDIVLPLELLQKLNSKTESAYDKKRYYR